MNRLLAHVQHIHSHDQLCMVSLLWHDTPLSVLLLEAAGHSPYLQVGATVRVLFNATEVMLATGVQGRLSVSNQLPAQVRDIQVGAVLSTVNLRCAESLMQAVVPTTALAALALQPDDAVTAIIPASAMILAPLS